MSLITGIPIRDSIHTDFSTGISGWGGYRTELTGEFTRQGGNVSGRYGEFSKDIQEYNRKINTLSGAWSDTGMFLTPYNAGFRYTGTGDFNKWDTYSLAFDGVDDYVTIDGICSAFSDDDAYSFSCWFKTDGSTDPDHRTNRILFSMHDASGGNIIRLGVDCKVTTGKGIYYADNGATYSLTSPAEGTLNDQAWHHLVITRAAGSGGQTLTIYIDGAVLGTVAGSDPDFDSAALASLGQEWDSAVAGDFFAGDIDEVAVWDSALSAEQITAIYNGGTPQSLAPYSPTAWWRMGDGILDGFGTHAGAGADLGLVTDEVNPTLGAEALPDPNFNNADDWAITGITGDEVFDVNTTNAGKLTAIAAHDGNLYEGVSRSMTNGQIYLLEIEVDTYTQGNFRGEGDCGTWNVPIGGVGTFKHYFRASGTRFRLLVDGEGGAGATFTATSISLKPVNGNAGLMINMAPADIVADTP